MSDDAGTSLWDRAKHSAHAWFSSDKDPKEPCQKCANRHWLDITVKPRPDLKKRPGHWPEEKLKAYANEPATVSAIPQPKTSLNGSGQVYVGSLPAGSHDIVLHELLARAKAHAKKQAEK